MSEDGLMTTEEVAQRLRVSTASVARYARTGVLEPVRLPGKLRFRPEDIDSFLASGGVKATVGPGPEAA